MPKQYEAIRDSLMNKMGTKLAKEHAAKIFIAGAKSRAGRSARAKSLQKDRYA